VADMDNGTNMIGPNKGYGSVGSNVTEVTSNCNGVTLFVTHCVISLELLPSIENVYL